MAFQKQENKVKISVNNRQLISIEEILGYDLQVRTYEAYFIIQLNEEELKKVKENMLSNDTTLKDYIQWKGVEQFGW